MTTKSDLLALHELFENSRNWTKGDLWRQHPEGDWCYCLTGGLLMVTGCATLDEFTKRYRLTGNHETDVRYRHARYPLEQQVWNLSEHQSMNLALWNDTETTTHPMVLDLLERAINLTP